MNAAHSAHSERMKAVVACCHISADQHAESERDGEVRNGYENCQWREMQHADGLEQERTALPEGEVSPVGQHFQVKQGVRRAWRYDEVLHRSEIQKNVRCERDQRCDQEPPLRQDGDEQPRFYHQRSNCVSG